MSSNNVVLISFRRVLKACEGSMFECQTRVDIPRYVRIYQ